MRPSYYYLNSIHGFVNPIVFYNLEGGSKSAEQVPFGCMPFILQKIISMDVDQIHYLSYKRMIKVIKECFLFRKVMDHTNFFWETEGSDNL